MASFADRTKQRELIAACNLLCDFVAGKLPAGFEIQLHMNSREAWIELIDPDGNKVECDSADSGISTIDDLCVTAIESGT